MKRLFLMAAYDKRNEVSPALLHYLRSLSACGDVIFVADNELDDKELSRLNDCTIARLAESHHEYDFGSYKRGWALAAEQGILPQYDRLYLVNDSVYGPLYELESYLEQMEVPGSEATAFVYNPHHRNPHLESWFMGFGKTVFLAPWFADFLRGVEALPDKREVCIRYENGLSERLLAQGFALLGLFTAHGRAVYNQPYALVRKGLPFFKRDAIVRHDGACRNDIRKILAATSPALRKILEEDILRLYGASVLQDIRSARPLKMAWRAFLYNLKKWL